ncbi:phage holin family protein [Pedobacter sp. PWIIR3]
MQNKSTKTIKEVWEEAKVFLNLKIEYYQLKVIEKGARLIADVITNTTVIFFIIIAFISAAVTLAFYFSALWHSYITGFGIAALFFLLMAIVVFMTKTKYMEKWVANFAIRRYLKKHYEDLEV